MFGLHMVQYVHMSRHDKFRHTLLGGQADANIDFADLRSLLLRLGFSERVSGDHFIFTRDGVAEIINIQPLSGGKAKPYQVRQVRVLIIRYGLQG